jgi:hypothetical protein
VAIEKMERFTNRAIAARRNRAATLMIGKVRTEP